MAVVELTGAPGVLEIYRRAALGALPARRPDVLPEHEVVLRGVTVDHGQLARYDRVCGFPLSDALPATYPHVLAFPLAMRLMTGADFPFPAVGTVHLGNRITLARSVDAREPFDLAVHAADLREHPRGSQFDIVASASVGGEQVWHGVSTYLRRSGQSTPRPADNNGPADDNGPAEGDRPAPPAASAEWRVTPRLGRDYAAASGDHNPIHTSALGARVFGFRRPIAHGMWSLARCLAALAGRLPEAYTVEVDFSSPVLLPGTVAFSASPASASPASAGPAWSFSLHDARSGRRHLSGTIT